MKILDIIGLTRKLAKTSYYQTLYSQSKEHGLGLFKNSWDYTELQMNFLRYLNFYSSLSLDVALGEIDERIFENEVYEDAYATYKNKKDKKPEMKLNKEYPGIPSSQWIFKKKK